MENFVKFDVKQFASGEYQVKIAERIYGDAIIHWNWFDLQQRDLMLLLTKIGAIKKQYGMIPITVYAPYLPYARQDRIFEAGQDIAIETLVKAICGRYDDVKIVTMALHCTNNYKLASKIFYSFRIENNCNLIYPDKNAIYHYNSDDMVITQKNIYFNKIRDTLTGDVTLSLIKNYGKCNYINQFIICDDICAGGRTFIECAKALRKEFGNDIKIQLIVYHAFLDHGLDALKESGISKINIINPDSYQYICKLYPNDLTYFEFKEI